MKCSCTETECPKVYDARGLCSDKGKIWFVRGFKGCPWVKGDKKKKENK